jgi:hypothetical protein
MGFDRDVSIPLVDINSGASGKLIVGNGINLNISVFGDG